MQLENSLTSSIISCWLEAITTPRRYTEGLQKMAELLDCEHASLAIWSRSGAWGQAYQATRSQERWKLRMEEHAFPAADLQRLIRTQHAGFWKTRALMQQAAEPHTALPAVHAGTIHCMRLIEDQDVEVLLCVQKKSWQGRFEKKLSDLAGTVIKGLRTALETSIRMRQLSQQLAQLSAVQNCIRLPVILLDSAMRIQICNAAAQSLFDKAGLPASPGLALTQVAGMPAERIAPLVRRACGKAGAIGASAMQIHSDDDRSDTHIVILPVKIQAANARSLHQALLLIHTQRGMHSSADQLLQHIYGLTPAEARLAMLILHGESPSSAAARLQVSVPTVRTQLSAVLKKTGAMRQADLVRRLSALLLVN